MTISIQAGQATTHRPSLFEPAHVRRDGIAYVVVPTFKHIDEMTEDRAKRQALKAEARLIHKAVNDFLFIHNKHQIGSTRGYTVYFAAYLPQDGWPLIDRLVVVAKICPLHTPTAADFFVGDDPHTQKRNVYCLQRLGGYRTTENLMSNFLGWLMRTIGRLDRNIHLIATYADTGEVNSETGQPHQGLVYKASGAVYAGLTTGRRLEGYALGGIRYSMRRGKITLGPKDIPAGALPIYATPKQRWCYAVGPNRLVRALRFHALKKRMAHFEFVPVHQPRLLVSRKPLWRRFLAFLIPRRLLIQ